LNAPGSWHDSRVARSIYNKLLERTPEPFYVIADTAFPRGPSSIQGKIKAPLKSGQPITADPLEQDSVLAFNRQLLSYRQTAEWGMRALQGAFPRLRVPLEADNTEARQETLETIVRLHNLRTLRIGTNEIREVYMPLWKKSEDERLWHDLDNMLFKDIRKYDRVSRFHLIVVENE
jgi:hypothetical protein